MRALSGTEVSLLKSRFQAGADGHSQQVLLTSRVASPGVITGFEMVRVALAPSTGMPVVLFRATWPVINGGDGLRHVWALRYQSQSAFFTDPVQVDVENVGIAETSDTLSQLGMVLLGSTLWALYRDATTGSWALRSSSDGVNWSPPQTPAALAFATSGYDERQVDLFVDGITLYVFWRHGAAIQYCTSIDNGVTWSGATSTAFNPGDGWGDPSPRFRVAKTAAKWHIFRFIDGASLSGHVWSRSTTTIAGWAAAGDVDASGNTGSGIFGHEYISGFDPYVRGATELALVWADAATPSPDNVVHRTTSTDDGATWPTSVQEGPPDPPQLKQPSALNVPAFIGLGGVLGQDDAWLVCDEAPNHIHVVTMFVGIQNSDAVYGPGIFTALGTTTEDVSVRVGAISLQKDDEAAAASFNLELQNTDGALNVSGVDGAGSTAALAGFSAPNVWLEIYQWYGAVADKQRTFSGIVDNAQENSAAGTILLVGRDQGKKLLTQRVIPVASQTLGVDGAIRDMENYVYLNKTLNEVLDNLLVHANLDSTATGRQWAPSSYVFEELALSSGTLMDGAKAACQVAGMRFWFDEDRLARTAPVAGPLDDSVWTYQASVDLVAFDADLSDDNTFTRVRVVGKANIGAKYLQAQFVFAAPAPDVRAIAQDHTTGNVWVLCGNAHLYLLDPDANMAIVSEADLSSWLAYPDSMDVGPDGHLWIADGLDATLGASAGRQFRKVDRAAPTSTLIGPFDNPDQLHVRLWHDQVNRLYMDTYASPAALVKVNDVTGAEVSRVVSPVNFPMGFDSDGQGGAFLTGWEQTNLFQVDLAGNIVNPIQQPNKNSNELSLDHDDLGLWAVFIEEGTIVKYAVAGTPSSAPVATLATAIDTDLERELLGEIRVLDILDLSVSNLAMGYATALSILGRVRRYTSRVQAGAIGNPGLQLHDRITVDTPAQGIAAGDYVIRSIRSDQTSGDGTYLAVLGIEPYDASF